MSLFLVAAKPVPVHAKPDPSFQPTAAYRWLEVVLETAAREVDRIGARPTILSRQMAIALTAMYDAWAAYDDQAAGTRLGGSLRRPPEERTQKNKEIAIAYATYRALADVYPADREWLAQQMRAAGLDPNGDTKDVTSRRASGTWLHRRCATTGITTARTSSATRWARTRSRTPTTPSTRR